MYSSNAYNTYKNNSINFASKDQLLLMLLDGAVRFSKEARQALLDKNIPQANKYLVKTQDIFYELISSLDLTIAGEWGTGLMSLYQFIVKRLMDANVKKNVEILDEVMPLIQKIRDMWYEADRRVKNKV